MSKFEDDIARGCLESGEPLDALYGVGWWTEMPEPEPDPVDLHIAELEARIAELEARQRWIPVSERLPDTKIVYDKFDVIVEFENIENGGMTRCVELMSYDYRNKSWNDDCGEYGFYPVAGVTHWRERPTPPEVQE